MDKTSFGLFEVILGTEKKEKAQLSFFLKSPFLYLSSSTLFQTLKHNNEYPNN